MRKYLSGIALAGLATMGQANLIVNGSFESAGNWILSGPTRQTNANYTAAGAYGDVTPFGSTVMAFNYLNQATGGNIQQTVTTTPNADYTLSFQMGSFTKVAPGTQIMNVKVRNALNNNILFETTINLGTANRYGYRILDFYSFTFKAASASTDVIFTDQSTASLSEDTLLDNVAVNLKTTPVVIGGKCELGDLTPDEAGQRATLLMRVGGVPSQQHQLTLGAGGQYLFSTEFSGSAELVARGKTWLSSARPAAVIGAGLFDQDFLLRNGDVDGNNVVTTDDYLILSFAFDTSAGDLFFIEEADLNQDGSVTTDDYLALSNNFDQSGD